MEINSHKTPPLRTRLAPTPSGLLHPGNGLSFILTWAIARAQGGTILLRIDDLDQARCREAYVEDIFRTIDWLGIDYDEGPTGVADFQANWSQHLRLDHYQQALEELRSSGQLFACACSRKAIRALAPDGPYPGTCQQKSLPFDQPNVAWRIFPPPTAAAVQLRIWQQGLTRVTIDQPDAWVLRQKDGFPAYQIASLIDDTHYKINFIVRGADLWDSTLVQCYLAQLLDHTTFSDAVFYHHPLLLDEKGNKLSKSQGADALQSWRKAGQSAAVLYRLAGQHLGLPHPVLDAQALVQALQSINKK
ncbi:MAG: tRNA glutamyl-Q synthetase [Bacteroidetes bacterium]|nr:MAG: tRNA glutamyl-Q synthetase [Bacteroidota bacterium]